jgi:hypothetical protein
MRGLSVLGSVLLVFAAARSARADWTVAGYLGASHTGPATLRLDVTGPSTASGVHQAVTDIHFDSASFQSPPYYGYRVGWFASTHATVGIEAELIHLKAFAQAADLPSAIQRFSMSHGLNLLLGNIVWRTSGGPLGLQVRGGIGVAIPHGESEVLGAAQEQYEMSSAAVQAAAGPTVRLGDHLKAFAEYKLTSAAPTVSVAGGTIKGRYTSQHLAFGLEGSW